MKFTADLHIHSRFSRATSKDLDFVALHRSALLKGIGLVATGDFTHPGWMAEIEEQLVPAEDGWFKLRPDLQRVAEEPVPASCRGEVRFVLEVEISNIYKKHDRTRKNHNLVFVPTIEAAKDFSKRLSAIGNLNSDGRPILGLDARHLLEITLEVDPSAFLVPAHIWTPWFSMFGSKSGFDSVTECFADLAGEIFAVETGLSSDPPMNWRVAELDRMTLISNSDAHSPSKLGREANLLDIDPGYGPMLNALRSGQGYLGTVEFFPEHGKYHLDGHRKCQLCLSPEQTRTHHGRCPHCGGPITVGVMSRVMDLADSSRPEGYSPQGKPPFHRLVPLEETLAEVLDAGGSSRKVQDLCARMLRLLGPESYILKDAPLEDVESAAGFPAREAIRRIRCGQMAMQPGYDGEFGVVKVFTDDERKELVGQRRFALPLELPSKPDSPNALERPHSTQGVEDPIVQTTTPPTAATSFSLNQLQLGVVNAGSEPMVVSAGPGTGKTRTLTERIAHQIQTGAWKAERVLALTFTNQAAAELSTRLNAALGNADARPMVTTFHGFGKSVLETIFGINLTIAEDETREALMAAALGSDAPKKRVQEMLEAVSLAKQSTDPVAAIASDETRAVYRRYQHLLEQQSLHDLDDLVLAAYSRLTNDADAISRLNGRFTAICVDEYQDVNDVQAALVRLLSPSGHNLLVIGDPDQAIYGFRGAQPGHFERFKQTYPEARAISLDTSYRLSQPILSVAQTMLGQTRALHATKPGPKVEVVACPTDASEAEQLLVRIEQLLGGSSHFALDTGRGADPEEPGIGFGDIAILCRLKTERATICTALARSGIPCLMLGEDEPHDPRSEKIAVMTMHASKGREFEVVFIVGVEQGLVPLALEGLDSDPEEERRLMYVAATRAKRRLIMSHARHRVVFGKVLPGRASLLLSNLPASDVSFRSAEMPKRPENRQLSLF